MKTYPVTIIETLEMVVKMEAGSPEEAERKAEDGWMKGQYVLDAECFAGVTFKVEKNRRK